MYRGSTQEQAQSKQKDALISLLKKQLYDLHDKDDQFLVLNDEISREEAQFALHKDQKERTENQHRIKTDINRKNIADLRTEIDNIKMQIHRISVHIEDVLRESSGVKRMCDNRQSQIASLMESNHDLQSKNQMLFQQNKGKNNRIKSLRDERNRYDSQNQRLHRLLEENIINLKNLQKEARMLEASNSRLVGILDMAEQDRRNLIEQVKSRDLMVNTTSKKLDQLNKEIGDLRDKTSKLQKQCLINERQLENALLALENSINKNKDQSKKIKQSENFLRGLQNELDKAILQQDAIENDFASLSSENNILNTQIDSLMMHIIEYEKVNKELQTEVQNYIQYDEQARSMLNRKDAMRNLLETVKTRLNQTSENIASLR